MSAQEIVDAEVVEQPESAREIVRRETPTLSVTPQVEAAELGARMEVIKAAMSNAMQKDVDYGAVPGTDKPTLLKPGAEKLGVLFQLDVQIENQQTWAGDHLTVSSKATVYHAPTGARLGYGEGMCSTRERKYAYRQAQRTCPSCGVAAIIKGKVEFGGGWVCFRKKGGCNAKFNDGDQAIEGQQVGEIDNPDLADLWNTVLKMAEKRARVDAILAVTGASAIFTQDMDEQVSGGSPTQAMPFGPAAEVEQVIQARKAVAYTLGLDPDSQSVAEAMEKVQSLGGSYAPAVALKAVVIVAATLRKDRETQEQPPAEPSKPDEIDQIAMEAFGDER